MRSALNYLSNLIFGENHEYPQQYVALLQAAYKLKKKPSSVTSLPENWEWHETSLCKAHNGHSTHSLFQHLGKIETFAAINHTSKTIAILIPGTDNHNDLIKDIYLKYTGKLPQELIDSKKDLIKKLMRSGFKLIFLGHSLGGAIAANLAVSFQETEQQSIDTITFESPGIMLAEDPIYDHIRDYAMLGPNPINCLHLFPGQRHIVIPYKLYGAFRLSCEHDTSVFNDAIDLNNDRGGEEVIGALLTTAIQYNSANNSFNTLLYYFDQHRLASFSKEPQQEPKSINSSPSLCNIYNYVLQKGPTLEVHPIDRSRWLSLAQPIKAFHDQMNDIRLVNTSRNFIAASINAVRSLSSGHIQQTSQQLLQAAQSGLHHSEEALKTMYKAWIKETLQPLLSDHSSIPEFDSAREIHGNAMSIRSDELTLKKLLSCEKHLSDDLTVNLIANALLPYNEIDKTSRKASIKAKKDINTTIARHGFALVPKNENLDCYVIVNPLK
ncbi:MAG TPA: hypothetical protein QF353_06710 [Gammaproteobacteria bacterium]|nr:hypothetical protein [Gammaproteobacteria bacterium]